MSVSSVASDVVVEPVLSRRQRKQFLQLPFDHYADDPNWIPPLLMDQKGLVGFSRHPFYKDAEARAFLAYRDGRPVGRVVAILNHAHNRFHNEKLGFFGFFESIDDPAVAEGLFSAVRSWFAERGIHHLRGPVNPSLNYECGLLVQGFDSAPYFMMTYNKPYYGRLIEGCGFAKCQDLFAYWGRVEMLKDMDPKVQRMAGLAAERFNVKIRPMSRKNFAQELAIFLDLYNQSLGSTWGFVPLSESEIHHMGSQLKQMIVPELALIAESDGKPVGVVFCLLDYNPRIKLIRGRLFPFGFIRLLRNRRAIKRMRIISANVVPEFQRWGIGPILATSLIPRVIDWGLEEAEMSWVLESNTLSRGSLERAKVPLSKIYRIYDSIPTPG
jgi:GNAT superfamily N-acetyltransferase